jgi:hypothetical protein
MKNPAIDLIQIFCSNFKCDIDLTQPPGLNRINSNVGWPSFEDCNYFNNFDSYEKKVKIHELEIFLKISRYSIETFQIVLASKNPPYHLKNAVINHYKKTSIDINFYPDKMIFALLILELIPQDTNQEDSIIKAKNNYLAWLDMAYEKSNK